MLAIKVEKLSKKFKDFQAVKNLSFEIPENRVVGFLGPNGAGKTTAIRMIVGLLKPSTGSIELAGKEVCFGQQIENSFGYLPEQPAFYNWMTGEEYLNFIADIFGLFAQQKEEKVTELLKLVDLAEAKDRKIGGYSNGMKQRLGIAQALVNEPKVLIMDEPVSALDPFGRREVLAVIEKLKEKMTVFMSTHVLSDVDRICDDIIIINKGQLITYSPLAELKAKYAKPIVEVEFTADPASIIPLLKKESWYQKHQQNGKYLKIWISDQKIIENNLPLKFLLKSKIGILKYGLIIPETEDLFVELVENQQ